MLQRSNKGADMNQLTKNLFLAIIFCFSFKVPATPMSVDISLNVSQFNSGPFSAGSKMAVSFDIDLSVIPSTTGTTNPFYTWSGALDNLTITVFDRILGTLNFTGQNGQYRQQASGFLSGSIGNGVGTVSPNPFQNDAKSGTSNFIFDPFSFNRMTFDFRLADSALIGYDQSNIVSSLTITDFDYLYLFMSFNHSTAGIGSRWNINRGASFNSVTFSSTEVTTPNILLLVLVCLIAILCLNVDAKLTNIKALRE